VRLDVTEDSSGEAAFEFVAQKEWPSLCVLARDPDGSPEMLAESTTIGDICRYVVAER
jgi:hypothetical protein